MDKIDIAKKIASTVVGTSVSAVVVTMINANTPTTTTAQKVKLYIGAYVIGAMVAERASGWTNTQIDTIVKTYKTLTTTAPAEQ